MPDDPAFAEILALRARLAHLEATAAEYVVGDPTMSEERAAARESRRQRDLAASFRRDPGFERILALQAAAAAAGGLVARDELAALMTPDTRMSLGFYETARASSMAEGLIDSKGEPR